MASLLAFAGVSVGVEWIVFLLVSIAMLAALRPLARRLDRSALDHGVGADGWWAAGPPSCRTSRATPSSGMVRVDREEWRAQSTDGSPIVAGTIVRVAEVQGTRVIVAADTPLPEPT